MNVFHVGHYKNHDFPSYGRYFTLEYASFMPKWFISFACYHRHQFDNTVVYEMGSEFFSLVHTAQMKWIYQRIRVSFKKPLSLNRTCIESLPRLHRIVLFLSRFLTLDSVFAVHYTRVFVYNFIFRVFRVFFSVSSLVSALRIFVVRCILCEIFCRTHEHICGREWVLTFLLWWDPTVLCCVQIV